MIKFILMLLVAAIAFAGTVAAILAITGNLSQESLMKIVSPAPAPVETAPEAKPDETDAVIRALQARDEDLNKREAAVKEEEDRLKKEQADLDVLRTQLVGIQQEIGKTIEAEDADHRKRVQNVALSLAKMKPAQAAKTLGTWSVQDAAKALRFMKDKERGKLLDAKILLYLQNEKLEPVLPATESEKPSS
jgi:flagellar motility protein MotE (MotC chaperone)